MKEKDEKPTGETPPKRRRSRPLEPFDETNPEARITLRDAEKVTRLAAGTLRNLRSLGEFVKPVIEGPRKLYFRLGDIWEWMEKRGISKAMAFALAGALFFCPCCLEFHAPGDHHHQQT